MSKLAIYDLKGNGPSEVIGDFAAISARLAQLGVLFERWGAEKQLGNDAGEEEVLAAYRDSVARLNRTYDFQSVDVIALRPDHPKKEELRSKFLSEHVHADFEMRFFVEGKGLFYIHVEDQVWLVLCKQGDLISVPANTLHWFDMGTNPDFKCIRLFALPDGWVSNFSGSDLTKNFPTFDQFVEAHAT